jgi:Fur family transcriptional regulator, peroxide stress response regulator
MSRPEILAAFRDRQVRCTPQRYTILDYLMRRRIHPTAEEIHTAINRRDPRASLATVYKSLHVMAKAGLIREVNVDGHAVRFESHTERHHHFVCKKCGRVEDVNWFDVPLLATRVNLGAREMHEYEIVMRGFCSSCQ